MPGSVTDVIFSTHQATLPGSPTLERSKSAVLPAVNEVATKVIRTAYSLPDMEKETVDVPYTLSEINWNSAMNPRSGAGMAAQGYRSRHYVSGSNVEYQPFESSWFEDGCDAQPGQVLGAGGINDFLFQGDVDVSSYPSTLYLSSEADPLEEVKKHRYDLEFGYAQIKYRNAYSGRDEVSEVEKEPPVQQPSNNDPTKLYPPGTWGMDLLS